MRESLAAEAEALALYREVLELVRDRSVALEEYAAAVDKMLRKPGELSAFAPRVV